MKSHKNTIDNTIIPQNTQKSKLSLPLSSKVKNAFTIVELLIVVVVIAILAAITIIAYNGITGQAKRAGVDSSLATAKKKVELFAVENSDTYPTSLSQAGIQGSDKDNQTTYRYTANNTTSPKSYCITAINGTNRSYTTNTSATPQSGSCPGHDNDSNYITNLVTNPSFENNIDGWEAFGGATIERTTEQAHSGQYSLKVVPRPTDGNVQIRGPRVKVAPGYYTYSVNGISGYVGSACGYNMGVRWYDAAGVDRGGGGSSYGFDHTGWSATTAGRVNIPVGVEYIALSVGLDYSGMCSVRGTLYLDDALIISGDHRALIENDWSGPGPDYSNAFFDGSSPSWVWNGTPHNSTSTGPIAP